MIILNTLIQNNTENFWSIFSHNPAVFIVCHLNGSKKLPLTYSSNSLKKISYRLRANWIGLWFYSLQKPGSVPKYGVICSALPSVLKQHHCPGNSEDLLLLHRTRSSRYVFHSKTRTWTNCCHSPWKKILWTYSLHPYSLDFKM